MNIALALADQVKGWKALPPDAVVKKIQQEKELPRWQVPGQVLEARDILQLFLFLVFG